MYWTPLFVSVSAGAALSIPVTVAVLLHVFHARSEKVNIKEPFQVKRYPVALSPVTSSLNHVMLARTS